MRWGEHRLRGTRPLGTHLQNRDGLTRHVGQDATGAPRAWVDEAVAKPLEKVRGRSLSPSMSFQATGLPPGHSR